MPRLGSRVRAPLSAPLHFRTVSSGPFSAKWPSGKAEACKAFTPGSNPGFASRQHPGAPAPVLFYICGHGSVGRAQPCQGWGRGFEPRCPLQAQQPDYYGSRAFSYPSHRLEPERERALSKRGAFVASWRGRRQAAEAGADPRSGYADAPLSAPTILRGSNEPRFFVYAARASGTPSCPSIVGCVHKVRFPPLSRQPGVPGARSLSWPGEWVFRSFH